MTLQQLKYAVKIAEDKSMSKAAKELYVTQPALSATIKDLEEEINIRLFDRTARGIEITPEGEDFLSYARQMVELSQVMDDQFVTKRETKRKFSVSMQHYTFAVEAFITLAKEYGMDEFEFAVHEAKTGEVIEDVKSGRSEIGILYLNDFNKKALKKIFSDNEVEFTPLFACGVSVYLAKSHPLAGREKIAFEELEPYPCISFEQGEKNSLYFAEEMYSTQSYRQTIKVDDRATALNLMSGLNGYTLCSGIICEELNGDSYTAVPLKEGERIEIGYIKKAGIPLSVIGQRYLKIVESYEPAKAGK